MKYHKFMHLLFPKRCSCGEVISPDSFFCEKCTLEYLSIIRADRITSLDFPAFFVADYSGCVRDVIHRFKFDGVTSLKHDIARDMAKLYFSSLAQYSPDFVVSVPSSRFRKFLRGYSHTDILSKTFSEISGVPFEKNLLVKIKNTAVQHTLSAEQRKVNLKDSFSVPEKKRKLLSGKKVLILDDISTTGSTLREAADTLLKLGAAEVFALTFASTDKLFVK